MISLSTKHLTCETGDTRHIASDDFESFMSDKTITSFAYACGDISRSAGLDRDLYDLRRLTHAAYAARRGTLTQRRMPGETYKFGGGAKFLYIFNKRKFLEDDDK